MSRWLDREEEKVQGSSPALDGLARSGADGRPRAVPPNGVSQDFGENRRERVVVGGGEYRIRPSELAAIHDVGVFRVAERADLNRGVYLRHEELARADLRSLKQQELIKTLTFSAGRGDLRQIVALSPQARRLAEDRFPGPQKFYSDFVRPSEMAHDSLLYRAYLHEVRRINSEGGSIKRIVLDHELKAKHFSQLNKPGSRAAYWKVQEDSARELHLPIVAGHVMIPDFRIEYETERGELSRADIEVATANYRGHHLEAKGAAGFRVYAQSGGGGRLGVDQGSRLQGNVFRQERGVVFPL
jgi:hypothetical protein